MATVDGKKTGGRQKGTANKVPYALRFDLLETLKERGFDPVAELIRVNQEAWKEYNRASEIYDAIQDKRVDKGLVPLTESTAPTYLKIAQDSAKDIMKYVYPQKKAVTVDPGVEGKNIFESLTEVFKKISDSK
jgi:hypothetical protein